MLTASKISDSDLLLDENFSINFSHSTLPIENSPVRLDRGLTCICTKGCAEISIDFINYQIEKGAIISAFPRQIMEQKYASKDFALVYIACSEELLKHVLFRFPPEFFAFLKETPVFKAPEKIYEEDLTSWKLIKRKYEDVDNVCRNEIVINMLRIYYLNIYNGIHHKLKQDMVKQTRGMELTRNFIHLVMEHHTQSREVAFYANKLSITPKYLSIITQEEKGQSAKKVIDDFIITEIKLRINASSKSILEISEELNFTDQAFFCKYFKRHTKLTPTQYRNK